MNTEVLRGATRWKFFLQASQSFLNNFFRDQTEGKPKFRGQNFRVNPKMFNDYFHLSVVFPWGTPVGRYRRAQALNLSWAALIVRGTKKQKNITKRYAQKLILVNTLWVNSKILTSKFWFSRGSISKMLV